MAESAYHNEALRRQRAIERKNEAQRRLLNGPQSNEAQLEGYPDYKDPILYSGPGHFEQSRAGGNHKIYHKRTDNNPVDKIYPLIHPKGLSPNRSELPPRKPHLKV